MDNYLVEDLVEKFKRGSSNSYIIITVGDLRDALPELIDIFEKDNTNKKQETQKLIASSKPNKKIVDDDEIITLFELERRLIDIALTKTNGNIIKACIELGLTERTMRRKLEEHNINYKDYRKNDERIYHS